MWALVKVTGVPTRSFDRPVHAGRLASLPRYSSPRMLVIRTKTVSLANDLALITSVSLTKSPVWSARISFRSSTSTMPFRRRISSMFSISTSLAMVDPCVRYSQSAAAHPPQLAEMRGHRRSKRLMRHVLQAKFLTRFLGKRRQCRIMNVTDLRKQVVLDLKVQSSNEPSNQPAVAGKIGGGFDLMRRPGSFHPAGVRSRHWKIRFLDDVS